MNTQQQNIAEQLTAAWAEKVFNPWNAQVTMSSQIHYDENDGAVMTVRANFTSEKKYCPAFHEKVFLIGKRGGVQLLYVNSFSRKYAPTHIKGFYESLEY